MRSFLDARLLLAVVSIAAAPVVHAGELLYAAEGNRLLRFDLDSLDGPGPVLQELVFENAATDPVAGRDINGMICAVPDGSGHFVAGEDTGQPRPRAGWGVLTPDGRQVAKLTPTALTDESEPYGCAFDAEGRLFTTEVGRPGFGEANGQLILWFPPFEGFPGAEGEYPDTDATSPRHCKIATDIGTAGGVAVDAEGRVYVASASGMEVLRFSPPFPSSADAEGGCGRRDVTGAPLADVVQRARYLGALPWLGMLTYTGLAAAPGGNLYVASIVTGRIAEFDPNGRLVRFVLRPPDLLPPHPTGHPQGLAVAADGTLYYADLALEFGLGGVEPGPDGKLWRIRFDADGTAQPPEPIATGLAFPDGLGVLPGDLEERAARGELRQPPPPRPRAPAQPSSGGRLLALAAALLVLAVAGRVAARAH